MPAVSPSSVPAAARPPLGAVPLRTAEFLVVDTETNGLGGERCELTEVGAVLVGGGELHDRWEALVPVRAPLSRSIQRFTGITQEMVDEAPAAELTLAELAELLEGRVLVAHNASFDRRVLEQAFARAGLAWPCPPVLCTVALARRLAPLVRQRKLALLADALGVPVEVTHRALADAETCARILCALLPRLCASATTVDEAVALLGPARPRAGRGSRGRVPDRGRTDGGVPMTGLRRRAPDLRGLPDAPGVYIFRNDAGQPLYVGKSVRLRARARSHFAPSSPDTGWVTQVEVADHVQTPSELGALLEEHRLIRRLRPPGNARGKHERDQYVFLRCRLDIAFPVLEVAAEPADGLAVNIGPLRGQHAAVELMEQLNSLFGLRHCGRTLRRRPWPSAYGQMGRCLSPCLGDLDPNAYRGRLDQALALFAGPGGGAGVLDHVDALVRAAAAEQAFERAAWLRRRRDRLAVLLDRLGSAVAAAHARPELVLGPSLPVGEADAVWLVAGRIARHAVVRSAAELHAHTTAVLGAGGLRPGGPCHLTEDDVTQARIVATWRAAQEPPCLPLDPPPSAAAVRRAAAAAGLPAETPADAAPAPAPTPTPSAALPPAAGPRARRSGSVKPVSGEHDGGMARAGADPVQFELFEISHDPRSPRR
ncbi:exonuclease domain-containing protein [Paraconexibacter antarcticus]|uniref:Exonuclease domain-containing protein n=1 Tax=Paraconexibacter antarcticus TaxID=2949664 RepID=A0ABY5DZG1_9ACTN|nr:exonuclease domain-containing protein [Paraconexibacter antarcticus]UTI66012.1 exonuclease domain-containing protein [Paraconexibacter antarcticus]